MFLDVTWLERPKLFISSTLDKNTNAHRQQLIKSLKDEGYEVIEFQDNSFPYFNTTDTDVINETINAVSKANIFILILDENYGTMIDTESVIHKEYKRAKELNLTIYVFINKHVWEDFENKKIGSESNVKSDEHYNFIKELAKYKISTFEITDDCLEHIKGQLLNFLGGCLKFSAQAKWLWNESYTRSIESNADEVWIITPDFMWDFDDALFNQIVVNNIVNRECKYKYIYKATEENKNKYLEMMHRYKINYRNKGKNIAELSEKVKFLPIKPINFFWSSEQILFNPFKINERAIAVDIMDVRDKTLKFNIEFGMLKRISFREQFIRYWNKHIHNDDDKIDENDYK